LAEAEGVLAAAEAAGLAAEARPGVGDPGFRF